jgi:hypothetical protein
MSQRRAKGRPSTIVDVDFERLTRDLVDAGKLIEAGWVGYRLKVLPRDASRVQIEETRKGFFAGAHHVFQSLLTVLEPGLEPTESDLRRLDLINAELERFAAEVLRGPGEPS